MARASEARQLAQLNRLRSEWTRCQARRERRRSERLRDECRETFGTSFARRALEDIGPLLDDADLTGVFVVLEGVGADVADHVAASRDRPRLELIAGDAPRRTHKH